MDTYMMEMVYTATSWLLSEEEEEDCQALDGTQQENFVRTMLQGLRVLYFDIDVQHNVKTAWHDWMLMYAPIITCTLDEHGSAFVVFWKARFAIQNWLLPFTIQRRHWQTECLHRWNIL
jgi:hypothetical protein